MKTEAPIVATGVEYYAANDSSAVVKTKIDGVVDYVDAKRIVVKNSKEKAEYQLMTFERSNAETCYTQRPIVHVGDKVKKGDIIADGPSTNDGEMSLGKNLTVAFMTYNGYNYEDAVIMNERLVKDDVYTSLHIEDYDTSFDDNEKIFSFCEAYPYQTGELFESHHK